MFSAVFAKSIAAYIAHARAAREGRGAEREVQLIAKFSRACNRAHAYYPCER